MKIKLKEYRTVLQDFLYMLPVVALYKPPKDDSKESLGRMFEETAARCQHDSAIIFKAESLPGVSLIGWPTNLLMP